MPDPTDLQNEVNTILQPTVYSNPPGFETVPTQNTTQPSPLVPPIQSNRQQDSIINTESNKNTGLIAFIIIIILLIIGILAIYFFRKSLFGPLTYLDCLEIKESTRVDLEPKYCVTPDGEMFFENRKLVPSLEKDSPKNTYNLETGPTSDPPL
jgi:hypothetical protein